MRQKRSFTLVDKERKEVAGIEEELRKIEIYHKNYPRYVAEQRKEIAEQKAERAQGRQREAYLKKLIDNQSAWEKFKGTYSKEANELWGITNSLQWSRQFNDLRRPNPKEIVKIKTELAEAKNNLQKEINKKEMRESSKKLAAIATAEKIRTKEKKVQQTKAKASAFDNEIRRGTDTIKSSLKGQVATHPYCPYCLNEITFSSCHADHIYPVNKGGLTTDTNMILVCKTCNLKKRDLTLRQFCRQNNFSYDDVCGRLEALHKDI